MHTQFTEEELIQSYSMMSGMSLEMARAKWVYLHKRYSDDYPDVIEVKTIAINGINLQRNQALLNQTLLDNQESIRKKDAEIAMLRLAARDHEKEKSLAEEKFAEGYKMKAEAKLIKEEALVMRDEVLKIKDEALKMKDEASQMMMQAMQIIKQSHTMAKQELATGTSPVDLISEMRDKAKTIFERTAGKLVIKENMRQQALNVFGGIYDTLLDIDVCRGEITKEEFIQMLCYIFGYVSKNPLQSISSFHQRGGDTSIYDKLFGSI